MIGMKQKKKIKNGKWVNYDYDWMFKEGAMKEIAKYADGVGPGWYMLIDDKKFKSRKYNLYSNGKRYSNN